MPYSWQLMHFIDVTYACFMTVPENVVNVVAARVWHSTQSIDPAPLGGTAGMCPVAPAAGSLSVGGAML